MNTQTWIAINLMFWIAAVAPVAAVILYRIFVVPTRLQEIVTVTEVAFPYLNEKARREETRKMLAQNPYISEPETTFDSYHAWRRYAAPLILFAAFNGATVFLVWSWIASRLVPGLVTPALNVNEVVLMALLGGYVWSFYQVISRAVDRELTPSDLYEITLGYIVSVPIGYVFSLLTDDLPNVRRVGAFVASAFPVRESNLLLRQYFMKKLGEPGAATAARTKTERSLRTAIQGVSDSNLARLAELRIFTALDMAYCDPIRVMVQTGFPLPVIIDWMDQSLWALYAGDFDESFAKLGLRCSLDVCEFVDIYMPNRGDTLLLEPVTVADCGPLKVVAEKLGSTPELTRDLFLRIYIDPQVRAIRELWYATGRASAFPYDTPAAAAIEKDAELWALYEKSFPAAEREPPKVIIKTVSSGKGFVVRSRANGITTGFSVVHMLEDPHAAFLVYLAVAPEHQSRGLGRGLLDISWQYARNQSAAEKKALTGMVWEVDIPDSAPNEEERNLGERRIHFFEQFGANVCRMAYQQPPLVGATPVPMHLMFKSTGGASMPDDAAVSKLVLAMYAEKYHDINGIDREVLDKLLAAQNRMAPSVSRRRASASP